jgi:hypothetical protein
MMPLALPLAMALALALALPLPLALELPLALALALAPELELPPHAEGEGDCAPNCRHTRYIDKHFWYERYVNKTSDDGNEMTAHACAVTECPTNTNLDDGDFACSVGSCLEPVVLDGQRPGSLHFKQWEARKKETETETEKEYDTKHKIAVTLAQTNTLERQQRH